jgi:hypothetical protein
MLFLAEMIGGRSTGRTLAPVPAFYRKLDATTAR